MKTLTINRPTGLRFFTKNPAYKTSDGINILQLSREQVENYNEKRYGSRTIENFDDDLNSIVLDYLGKQTQVVVEKRLSRDLEVSSLVGDVSKIIWPDTCFEVKFEDPELPSILFTKESVSEDDGTPVNYRYLIGYCLVERDTEIHRIGRFNSDEWKAHVQQDAEMLFVYPDEPDDPPLCPSDFTEEEKRIDEEKCEAEMYIIGLCLKAIAYSSIPQFAPSKLLTRKEKKEAGIHPFHQTEKPAFIIRHLPRVLRIGTSPDIEGNPSNDSSTHRFYGRAGHIRFYENERFKNMKGKWQWIPPIQPPEGIKVIYQVHKIKGARNVTA